MSDPEEHRATRDDDVIKFVEILAVLIRHRRLIVLGIAIPTLLTAATAFLLPTVGLWEGYQPVYTAEQRVIATRLPNEVQDYVPFDPAALLVETADMYTNDPVWVGSDRVKGSQSDEGRDRLTTRIIVQYEAMARDDAIAGVLSTIEEITMTFQQTALTRMIPVVAALDETIERSIADATDTGVQPLNEEDSELVKTIRIRDQVKRFVTEPHLLYTPVDSPAIVRVSPDLRLKIVITVGIAMFFFSILAAFVAEYVQFLKSDAGHVETLRSAWRRGKKKGRQSPSS